MEKSEGTDVSIHPDNEINKFINKFVKDNDKNYVLQCGYMIIDTTLILLDSDGICDLHEGHISNITNIKTIINNITYENDNELYSVFNDNNNITINGITYINFVQKQKLDNIAYKDLHFNDKDYIIPSIMLLTYIKNNSNMPQFFKERLFMEDAKYILRWIDIMDDLGIVIYYKNLSSLFNFKPHILFSQKYELSIIKRMYKLMIENFIDNADWFLGCTEYALNNQQQNKYAKLWMDIMHKKYPTISLSLEKIKI